MPVTPADVAATLGRSTPDPGAPEYVQWSLWIGYATRTIERRAERRGLTLDDLNPDDLAMVITEAVAAKVKQPDAVRRVDVSIDDGRIGKEYATATGQVDITEAWWDLLFPGIDRAAYSTRPAFVPDTHCPPWTVLP